MFDLSKNDFNNIRHNWCLLFVCTVNILNVFIFLSNFMYVRKFIHIFKHLSWHFKFLGGEIHGVLPKTLWENAIFNSNLKPNGNRYPKVFFKCIQFDKEIWKIYLNGSWNYSVQSFCVRRCLSYISMNWCIHCLLFVICCLWQSGLAIDSKI